MYLNKRKCISRLGDTRFHQVSVRRKSSEDPVISGLSVTPSQIEQMARNGIPVSVPNASNFFTVDSGRDVPPELRVDADRNTLWETSQAAKARIMRARRKEHDHLT